MAVTGLPKASAGILGDAGPVGGEQGEPTPPLTLLSRQAEGSLAEQHSSLTFLQVSYSLPRKASGTLVCLRVSSNRYLERGKNESPCHLLLPARLSVGWGLLFASLCSPWGR